MTEQFLAASPNKNFRELYSKLLDHADSDLTIADYDRCYEAMRFVANVVEKPVQTKNRPQKRSVFLLLFVSFFVNELQKVYMNWLSKCNMLGRILLTCQMTAYIME